MLIAPEFAPITHSFGFLQSPLESVLAELKTWKAEIHDRSALAEAFVTLREGFRALEPLGAPWFSRLWIETTSALWPTAYFDGSINGGDPFPPISYLARRMHCLGLVVVAAPDSIQLQEYGGEQTEWLNLNWSVVATKDDPWYWQHFGEIRSFEEESRYSERRVRDRFTIDMLRRYCEALGVPLDADQFGPHAVLERPAIPPGEHRFETLSQARTRLGLPTA